MARNNIQPMKWKNYVNNCTSLNNSDVNCLEWAVTVASNNLTSKFSTIFRCGWISKDGSKCRFHVLPIYNSNVWNIINYVPELNDLENLDIRTYKFSITDQGMRQAIYKFSSYFLPMMSEHFNMNESNSNSAIQIVDPIKFREFLNKYEGTKILQSEVLKILFTE